MSRAFVKEPDGDQVDDDRPPRPRSESPAYITRAGFDARREQLEQLQAEVRVLTVQADDLAIKTELKRKRAQLRDLKLFLAEAIPVDVSTGPGAEIRFGMTVELADEDDRRHTFKIVGEEESNPEQGCISWVSPLARELLGKRRGDTLRWRRARDALELEVIDFH